jgi:DNA repair photolyase
MKMVKVSEIMVKSAMNPTGLDYDYSLNPYKGCEHGCVYCYAPHILREKRKWGSFVDVKMNIPELVAKEVKKRKRGLVGIGTVTDPYQPVESKYKITQKCLEELLRHDWPVSVQTKSSLIMRDFDLLSEFSKADIGVTVTALDDKVRKKYEPCASSVEERFDALHQARDHGIKTWVFFGPVLPEAVGDVDELIAKIAETEPSLLYYDKLRYHKCDYDFAEVEKRIINLCEKMNIKYTYAFG